jgi:hypothetical protein
MSLTLYINRTKQFVKIVTWFKNSKGVGDFAGGPIIDLAVTEFRQRGWKLICGHIVEYKMRKLSDNEMIVGSLSRADKIFLAHSLAIRVKHDASGMVELIPCAMMKMTLVGDECLPKETRKLIKSDDTDEVFWNAFDEVLETARKREDPDP